MLICKDFFKDNKMRKKFQGIGFVKLLKFPFFLKIIGYQHEELIYSH